MSSNPCCGDGMFDRRRDPHCYWKCYWPAVVHYDGCGLSALVVILTTSIPFFLPLGIIYALCIWQPQRRVRGDTNSGPTNPIFSKGCWDRDREPHVLLRVCPGGITQCEYDGCCTLFHLLGIFNFWPPLCFCALPINALMWQPRLDRSFEAEKQMSGNGNPYFQGQGFVGQPVVGQYGSTCPQPGVPVVQGQPMMQQQQQGYQY